MRDINRHHRQGHLFIIGGHEDREDDKIILKRFIDLCGGPEARIFVLTAASTLGGPLRRPRYADGAQPGPR